MEFNEKLQELRKNRGLTQEELAEALYVSRTAISKWESGICCPDIQLLPVLAKFFDVTIDDGTGLNTYTSVVKVNARIKAK